MGGSSTMNQQLQRLWIPVLLAQVFARCAVNGKVQENITAKVDETVSMPVAVFSQEWLGQYNEDDVGCHLGRGSYTWRKAGLGSNLNNMLNAWAHTLTVEGWTDLALIDHAYHLRGVNCSEESGGHVQLGWNCLFDDMPHLCKFDNSANWTQYMVANNVSNEDQTEARRVSSFRVIRSARSAFSQGLKGTGVDHLGAMAAVSKHLWNHMTPWLQHNVNTVINLKDTFQRSPFVGIHVRRGDKLDREAELHKAEEYLSAAVAYLEGNPNSTRVDDIRGIWVASDDGAVIDEVRNVSLAYFPGVSSENIVYAARGMPGGPQDTGMVTYTDVEGYGSFVYSFTDLHQLARADVFVGTFSSNFGRLVMVLREGLQKERTSGMSLDFKDWYPVRKQL